jgi:ferrochelatase
VHTEKQARLLRGYFASKVRMPLSVDFAMRYGEPSIQGTLARLKSEGCERVLVLPMYPQYAASTTASALDEVGGFVRQVRNVPEIRLVKHFYDHPLYIAALANLVREYWRQSGRPDRLLMSFHGLPRYTLARGDPYHFECQRTARLLAGELELAERHWQTAFQSRFGRAEWIEPYTVSTLADYGRQGVRRVDVICPGDARRNRHRGSKNLPRCGRQGISPVALPQRACRLDQCLGRHCAAASCGLGERILESAA